MLEEGEINSEAAAEAADEGGLDEDERRTVGFEEDGTPTQYVSTLDMEKEQEIVSFQSCEISLRSVVSPCYLFFCFFGCVWSSYLILVFFSLFFCSFLFFFFFYAKKKLYYFLEILQQRRICEAAANNDGRSRTSVDLHGWLLTNCPAYKERCCFQTAPLYHNIIEKEKEEEVSVVVGCWGMLVCFGRKKVPHKNFFLFVLRSSFFLLPPTSFPCVALLKCCNLSMVSVF